MSHMATNTTEARELGEMFESACALASRMYDAGADTTEADAEVDRLHALLVEKGLA